MPRNVWCFVDCCALQIVISPVKIVVQVLATRRVTLVLKAIFSQRMAHALVRIEITSQCFKHCPF